MTPQQLHIPVLLDEVIELLAPQRGESYLDLTVGYGGHAKAIIERTGAPKQATLADRDQNAIREIKSVAFVNGARFLHSDFLAAAKELCAKGERYDMILMDLGVSSPQLDTPKRGFSFSASAPLDMRMDESQSRTAAEIINRSSEKDLADIIMTFGEENPKLARKIAHAVRIHRPVRTTTELADIITGEVGRRGKIHPATKTFQAIRIAVNDELRQLEETLPLLPELLNPGGRLAIISFHSLEDRLVKRFLSEHAEAGYEADLRLLTKKPVIASATELVNNPRARSAKLRAAVKQTAAPISPFG